MIALLAAAAMAIGLSSAQAQKPSSRTGDANSNVAANAIFPGENLLTPYLPPSPEWEALEKQEPGIYKLVWIRGNELYAISVFREFRGSLGEAREYVDAPGRSSCEAFNSVVRSKQVAPYPSLTWLTECKNGGRITAQLLTRAIRGNDSSYLIQRSWRGPANDQDLRLWETRLAEVSVCDTRKPEVPCPGELPRRK
jgi:hypothetical protein